jgi:hypothetical protein
LSEEFNKIGLGYIWQDPKDNSMSRMYEKIKERCSAVVTDY